MRRPGPRRAVVGVWQRPWLEKCNEGHTCGGVPLESSGVSRVLLPQVPLLRGALVNCPAAPCLLGGGCRGALRGVGRISGSRVGLLVAGVMQARVAVLSQAVACQALWLFLYRTHRADIGMMRRNRED